ncbi:MAG TPA: DoxX family membrane protein, partial [Acidothermaceae bacterium]|nr:DoxX family membrane protein [Acidothermaceae bacterium]
MGRVRRQPLQLQALPRDHQARWLWFRPPPAATALAGWALLPLRLFLGLTFCFAGLQKLANPSFFHASNPGGIQAQMLAASRRSPIHALLTPLAHHAVLIGTVIALGEVAVGVGALLGLLTRIAAFGGLLISLNLFLA